MTHYVCTGDCKGVSNELGICETESCPRYHEPFVPCNCLDGTHEELVEEETSAPMDEEQSA